MLGSYGSVPSKKKKNTASLYNELWQVNGHMAARGAENKGQLGAQS